MPIYEYRCESCGQVTEDLIRNAREAERVRCGQCGDSRLTRVYLTPIAPVPAARSAEVGPCCGDGQGCADPKRCCQQQR
jgi:putative FmdB family regulatory protein